MRSSPTFVKLFVYATLSSILVLMFIYYRDVRFTQQMLFQEKTILFKKIAEAIEVKPSNNNITSDKELKYILIWTNPTHLPFAYLGTGKQGFIDRKCPFTNCFVTSDKHYLSGDLTKFDIIAFHGPEVVKYELRALPSKRSPQQKYVFGSIESSGNYPRCDNVLDGFFNWTWTYKLNSDARWGYLVVRDSQNKVIGPNTVMHWMDWQDMDPVSDELKDKLKSKTKAAAWLVSNCYTKSKREYFVKLLKIELRKFGLKVDIYGKCGNHKCGSHSDCMAKIEKDYFFYLSFENSFSEDYVTEKLMHAVHNNAVPIVFGGANYTRFLPGGSYLNARELGEEKLALVMNDLIKNPEQYYEYFRWRNHYSYHNRDDSLETNDYCRFCAMLNDEQLMNKTTVYKNFKEWWTPPGLLSISPYYSRHNEKDIKQMDLNEICICVTIINIYVLPLKLFIIKY